MMFKICMILMAPILLPPKQLPYMIDQRTLMPTQYQDVGVHFVPQYKLRAQELISLMNRPSHINSVGYKNWRLSNYLSTDS